jgi:hypothetical protein
VLLAQPVTSRSVRAAAQRARCGDLIIRGSPRIRGP